MKVSLDSFACWCMGLGDMFDSGSLDRIGDFCRNDFLEKYSRLAARFSKKLINSENSGTFVWSFLVFPHWIFNSSSNPLSIMWTRRALKEATLISLSVLIPSSLNMARRLVRKRLLRLNIHLLTSFLFEVLGSTSLASWGSPVILVWWVRLDGEISLRWLPMLLHSCSDRMWFRSGLLFPLGPWFYLLK